MEATSRNLPWRISALGTLIAMIIYSVIFVCLGYVPEAEKIILSQATENLPNFSILPESIDLPEGISRLWDIPIIFIFIFTMKSIMDYIQSLEKETKKFYKIYIIGLALSSVVILIFLNITNSDTSNLSLNIILALSLAFQIGITLTLLGESKFYLTELREGFCLGAIFGVMVGIGSAFLFGYKSGLVISLILSSILSLASGFAFCLGYIIGLVINHLFSTFIKKDKKNKE